MRWKHRVRGVGTDLGILRGAVSKVRSIHQTCTLPITKPVRHSSSKRKSRYPLVVVAGEVDSRVSVSDAHQRLDVIGIHVNPNWKKPNVADLALLLVSLGSSPRPGVRLLARFR